MLSTPPAFNLSQNQTLQFKSVAKIPVGTEIRISKFFPLALHLSMNHSPFHSAREAFLRSLVWLVNFFFAFSENFFSASRGSCRLASALSKTISRRLSRTFLQLRNVFASPRCHSQPAKADTTPSPPRRQAFFSVFCFLWF